MNRKIDEKSNELSDYATFYLKDALCGISLSNIQEINKPYELTVVPQSPDYVMGIINLRGKIVTVIDTGKMLHLNPIITNDDTRTIIVKAEDEFLGLMVDRIGNVVTVEPSEMEAPPANIGDISGRCFEAIFKTERQLVGLLSIKTLFQ